MTPVPVSIWSAARSKTIYPDDENHRPSHGHLAQLEEHPLDVRKVGGSNPSMSTIQNRPEKDGFLLLLLVFTNIISNKVLELAL